MQMTSLLISLFVSVAWLILFAITARLIYLWISAYYGNDQQKGPYGRLDRVCPKQKLEYARIILSVFCENATLPRAVQRRRD